MKKAMKKPLLALAMSLALLLTFLPVIPAAAAGEFTAKIAMFMDDGFNAEIEAWPDTANFGGEITFNIGQEATMTVDFGQEVKFANDFSAIETNVPNEFDRTHFVDPNVGEILSLKLDGVDVPMGAALVNAEGADAADGDGKGVRLTIRNGWAPDLADEDQPLVLAELGPFTVLEVTFIIRSGSSDGAPPPPAMPEFDPMGEYNAFLGIQINTSWIFRDSWASPTQGANGTWPATDGVNYFDRLMVSNWDAPMEGVFTDVVLAGNGTYKVSLNDYGDFDIMTLDGNEMLGDRINLLYVSTNIPFIDDIIEFSDVKVTIDGRMIFQFRPDRDQFPYVNDGNGLGYYHLHVLHHWEMEDLVGEYNVPVNGGEIAIEFTISGFGYDKAEEPGDGNGEGNGDGNGESTPTPPADSPPPTDSDPDDGGLGFWLWVIIGGAAVIVVVVVLVVVKGKKK